MIPVRSGREDLVDIVFVISVVVAFSLFDYRIALFEFLHEAFPAPALTTSEV